MAIDVLYYLTIRPLEILFETVFFLVYNRVNKPFATLFALSLIVNILVFPLYRRADKLQSEQREREKAMESRISHIKKTFKGDEKVMMLQAYYRINDYKPVYALRGGCPHSCFRFRSLSQPSDSCPELRFLKGCLPF
nr:hypothetical protein [Lachnospiraceae bacterium]